jgi:3-oxoacyl-[acyl-carrier-protein] synthase II
MEILGMNRKVVVTGLGAVTPIGNNIGEYWQGLVEGRSGAGPITLFDAAAYPVKIASEVKNFDPAAWMPLKRMDRSGRCTHFAIAAAKMALESAAIDLSAINRQRMGVVIATTGMVSLNAEYGEAIKNRPMRIDPLFITRSGQCMVPSQVGLEIGAKGINTSINSACASGSDALGAALSYLRLGYADIIIAGGAEAGVNPVSLAVCARVGALSRQMDPSRASRPFDRQRDGFVLGEGAGILVLETLEHARQRGAHILAELAGAGWSFDAFNETAPDYEQEAAAIRNALENAGLAPGDIDYINAHGTSTRLNDSTETRAIKAVFGSRAYSIPVSSNKSMIGHLAAAAGAVEAVACVLTLNNGIIPPTIHYENPDPECDLDYVPGSARYQTADSCLSNSFGMGGQNCCLVIKKFKEE